MKEWMVWETDEYCEDVQLQEDLNSMAEYGWDVFNVIAIDNLSRAYTIICWKEEILTRADKIERNVVG
ncbi:MAG: hypothetical protein GY861_12605 [bacterium]|nr:hypothetical protein [bacterium]